MAVEALKPHTTRMDVMPIAKFAEKYLLDVEPLSDHQMRWFDHIHFGGDRIVVLGPRGHGKTTIDWIYLLWRICYDQKLTILIASNTQPLASAIVRMVQKELEDNEPLKKDFNISPASPWRFGIAYLEGGRRPVLQGIPTLGQMTGFRYDILLFDDLITIKNIATEDLLNKIKDWLSGSVMPALNPKKQKIIFVGTRKGTRDYYDELLANPDYKCLVDRAIKEDGTALWPEGGFTLEELEKRKRNDGALKFAREYMNDPQIKKGMTLQREWLKIFEQPPPAEFVNTFIGVDPGLGSSSRASYFAIAVVQVDKRNGRAYVVEFFRERYSAIVVQRKKVLELYEKWAPVETVYVESVFAYKYFADDIHMHIPNVQPIDYVHDKLAGEAVQKKEDRIQIKLGPLFEKGKVWIRDPEHDRFTGLFVEEEYIAFPKGPADMLDALVMACNSLYQEPITLENLGIYAG